MWWCFHGRARARDQNWLCAARGNMGFGVRVVVIFVLFVCTGAKTCTAARGCACTTNADCARGEKYFCSSADSKCQRCEECHAGVDAVGGSCPAYCEQQRQTCEAHAECRDAESCMFCCKARRCRPCDQCVAPESSVDGDCPAYSSWATHSKHTPPDPGSACSAHVDCDRKLEFCSLITNTCEPCREW